MNTSFNSGDRNSVRQTLRLFRLCHQIATSTSPERVPSRLFRAFGLSANLEGRSR